MKALTIQFIKYFAVALVGYIVDFGGLLLLTEYLHWHYLLSSASSFIMGLIVVYCLSDKYVFGESKIKSQAVEFGIFAIIGIVGLGILGLLMWLLTDGLHIHYILSKLVATIVVYAWNFFARRAIYHN